MPRVLPSYLTAISKTVSIPTVKTTNSWRIVGSSRHKKRANDGDAKESVLSVSLKVSRSESPTPSSGVLLDEEKSKPNAESDKNTEKEGHGMAEAQDEASVEEKGKPNTESDENTEKEGHGKAEALETVEVAIPEDYMCPITYEIMRDPVMTTTGDTYERSAITTWFLSHDSDPLTNQKIDSKTLLPNRTLRKAIESFCEKNGVRLTPKATKGVKRSDPNATGLKRKHARVDACGSASGSAGGGQSAVVLPISAQEAPSAKRPRVETPPSQPEGKAAASDAVQWFWMSDLSGYVVGDDRWTAYPADESMIIEAAYEANPGQSFQLNDTYSVDLVDMCQYRTDEPYRRRLIRRGAAARLDDGGSAPDSKKPARWFWKSDLEMSSLDPSAWTQYSDGENKAIENAFSNGQSTLQVNAKYSLSLGDWMQYQTLDPSRVRPVKRDPMPAGVYLSDDESVSEADSEELF